MELCVAQIYTELPAKVLSFQRDYHAWCILLFGSNYLKITIISGNKVGDWFTMFFIHIYIFLEKCDHLCNKNTFLFQIQIIIFKD